MLTNCKVKIIMTNQEIFDKIEVDVLHDLSTTGEDFTDLDLEINNNVALSLDDGHDTVYVKLSHPQALELAKYILTSLNVKV